MPAYGVEPKYISYLFSKARAVGAPFSGTFELTSRCNLQCKMCYIHSAENDITASAKELSVAEWSEIASSAAAEGTVLMLLTGGEPLAYEGFFEVFDKCKSLGMIVSLNSNGTMLTEKVIERFSINPPSSINISLYGTSPEAYEKTCGNGAMFNKVSDAVKKLKSKGIRVKLNYSITEGNALEMNGIFTFAKNNKINVQTASYMFPPVRASEYGNSNAARPTAENAGSYAARSLYSKYGREDFLQIAAEIEKRGISAAHLSSCIEQSGNKVMCRAGSCTYWVTFDGRLLPCGMMTAPSVDLRITPFSEAWGIIKAETAKITLPNKCAGCKIRYACEVCAASCLAETGGFDKAPDYQCRKAAAFISELERLKNKTGGD